MRLRRCSELVVFPACSQYGESASHECINVNRSGICAGKHEYICIYRSAVSRKYGLCHPDLQTWTIISNGKHIWCLAYFFYYCVFQCWERFSINEDVQSSSFMYALPIWLDLLTRFTKLHETHGEAWQPYDQFPTTSSEVNKHHVSQDTLYGSLVIINSACMSFMIHQALTFLFVSCHCALLFHFSQTQGELSQFQLTAPLLLAILLCLLLMFFWEVSERDKRVSVIALRKQATPPKAPVVHFSSCCSKPDVGVWSRIKIVYIFRSIPRGTLINVHMEMKHFTGPGVLKIVSQDILCGIR